MRLILALAILLFTPTTASPDWFGFGTAVKSAATIVVDNPFVAAEHQQPGPVVGRSEFHQGIVAAAVRARQAGKITARESLRIRVAMLSPAFRDASKKLALTQMAFSGSDQVPVDANGKIDETQIDWAELPAFLEAMILLLIQLLELFGIS